jgi:hypothetical protein
MIKLFYSKKARVLCVIIALAALPLASAGDWIISPDWAFDPYPGPTVVTSGYSTSLAGASCIFSCQWQAVRWQPGNASYPAIDLDSYIFSINTGGGWQNDTATSFPSGSDWANVTKTLPSTVGTTVSYRWYANDSVGGIGVSDTYSFVTTAISISFTEPTDTIYTTNVIPLELATNLNGTISTITYNVKRNTFPASYVYSSAQTYSGPVNITLSQYGRYTIEVSATSTEGGTGEASYTFTYNPTYTDSINSDWMWQYLNNYDIVGFVVAAWTVDLGESFYVIISMILTLALYIRLKNLPVMIAMWFTLGTLWVGLIPMASPIILLLYVFGFVSLAFYLYGVSKY